MKYVTDLLAPAITYIFNFILRMSIFPIQMQVAKAMTLHKGSDAKNLSHNRPVPILMISKGMERITPVSLISV